jgi:hypothetical protein
VLPDALRAGVHDFSCSGHHYPLDPGGTSPPGPFDVPDRSRTRLSVL